MYHSLKRTCPNAHLFIFAFDSETEEYLRQLRLEDCTIIGLKDFEDEDLLAVKKKRSIAEYCWTSTSSTLLYIFSKFQVSQCTYVDADLYFYHTPELLIEELPENKSVLLTLHNYTPKYDVTKYSGRFCVQFMTFKNNQEGISALQWWRNRCLEWCFARYEEGKFGDQKYLDDWETRFSFVHVLRHKGSVAPWNIQQYEWKESFNLSIDNQIVKMVFYHFHYVRFYYEKLELGRFQLSKEVMKNIYIPYVNELLQIENNIPNSLNCNGRQKYPFQWKTPLVQLLRTLKGVNHLYSWNEWEELQKGVKI